MMKKMMILMMSLLTPSVLGTGCAASVSDEPDAGWDDMEAGAEEAGMPAVSVAQESLTAGETLQFLHGLVLFQHEEFNGNGRTCGTCHLLLSSGDIAPSDVERAWRRSHSDPLFRSIDSDDGVGSDYTLLRRDATFRIPFVLPPGVTVDDPAPGFEHLVHRDTPTVGQTTVFVRRSSPSVFNMVFDERDEVIMWDGREASLEAQATSAVLTHNEPGRLPTASEEAALAFFQRQFFTSPEVRAFARTGTGLELPPGRTASEIRGRGFFVSGFDAEHRGLCATCHSGPMLNTTDAFNPLQPAGERLSNNFVSEFNVRDPRLTYHAFHPVFGPVSITSPDPGRLLVTGDPCELFAACVVNPGSTVSFFKIPTLWGTRLTAPYFHDNSAENFDDVMDQYQILFDITVAGLNAQGGPGDLFILGPQDRVDIIAYMNYAFR